MLTRRLFLALPALLRRADPAWQVKRPPIDEWNAGKTFWGIHMMGPLLWDKCCEDTANWFLSLPQWDHWGVLPYGFVLECVKHLARTSSPEYRKDAVTAIEDGMLVLPYIRPDMAHFNPDVVRRKAVGWPHPWFNLPPNTPVESVMQAKNEHLRRLWFSRALAGVRQLIKNDLGRFAV